MSASEIKAAEQRLTGQLSQREIRLLIALSSKPLSTEDVIVAMQPIPEQDTKGLLYQLVKKFLIVKQPVVSDGCRECGSMVHYLWRLTFSGRQASRT